MEAFDAAGGLRLLLNLLRHAAQLASGASAQAKQTASHACHALRQYFRAHLHRRVTLALAGVPAEGATALAEPRLGVELVAAGGGSPLLRVCRPRLSS